ncbi:MAG: putative quinol monooxygenase [Pseudomonadota bacterium]
MPTIITAKARFAAHHVEAVKAASAIMTTASQAEDGCIDYAFAQDVTDQALFRIVEIWEDDVALARHFKMPHMAVFSETLAACPPESIEALRHVSHDTGPLDIAAFQDP